MRKEVFIIEAKRTATGKYGGSLSLAPASDLAAQLIKYISFKFPKIINRIDEIIIGNVLSAGIGQNPARIAAMKGGLSHQIPAFTINKVCGSGLKSIILGTQIIQNDDANLIMAGGMENMSQCPYYLDKHRFGAKFNHHVLRDGMLTDGLFCSLIGKHMGFTAEILAKKYKISRIEQDLFALNSHKKAMVAIDNNKFKEEIIPIKISSQNKDFIFKEDEQVRKKISIDSLSKLKPVFKKNGTVTAGNSCPLSDGAAIVLLATEKMIKKYHLIPKVIIKSYAYLGFNPRYMGLGSYYAAKKCLKKVGLKPSSVGLWEINEAFASQSLAVLKLLKINPEIVNVNGGAIALGHPIGASGTKILTTLIYELKRRKLRYGMASLCIGGGQGIAILIENINC